MSLFWNVLGELAKDTKDKKSGNDLNPWEEDARKDEDYEDYNFEEEELEEDDYYFDDDK